MLNDNALNPDGYMRSRNSRTNHLHRLRREAALRRHLDRSLAPEASLLKEAGQVAGVSLRPMLFVGDPDYTLGNQKALLELE